MENRKFIRFAEFGLITIFLLGIIFHVLVLFQVVDFKMVWGGKIKTISEMYTMETVSLLINFIFLIIIILKGQNSKKGYSSKIITGSLWVMFSLFLLNTVGNLFSESMKETIIFTPITLLSSVFCFILVRNK